MAGGNPIPTAYRFFTGGALNKEAVDNLAIAPGMMSVPDGPPTISAGMILGGDVRSAYESDDRRLVMRPGIATVNFVLTYTVATANPAELDFIVESSANQANIGQKIFAFNNTTNSDELLDSHTLTTTDTTTTAVVTANASRFIDANHNVKLRIICRAVAPVLSYPWQARFDRAVLRGTP